MATALSRMAHILLDIQTLNIAFTTIHVLGALYKKGRPLTQEEKVLNMDKKF
jgi:hypothetical protein